MAGDIMANTTTQKHKPSLKPLAPKREALLATSRALGSLAKSAANIARKLNQGAGIVSRKR
jgi:hypothetical protein